jgi:hypothetical protein
MMSRNLVRAVIPNPAAPPQINDAGECEGSAFVLAVDFILSS